MKLTEGLGLVNNLIFFRFFFFFFFCKRRFSLNISKRHEELSGFCYLFLGHILDGLGRSSWIDVNASKWGLLLQLSLFACAKKGSLHRFLGLDTWLVRSPKVHSKSSRLAAMGKWGKGVNLQVHYLPSSFFSFLFLFYPRELSSKSRVRIKDRLGASFSPLLYFSSWNNKDK